MNERRESDKPIRPKKAPNKGPGAPGPTEGPEERGLAKGNPLRRRRDRTQRRVSLNQALERIRQAAGKGVEQFTALWHHVYNPDRLRESFVGMKRTSAPGVDRVTWKQYQESLEENLEDLSGRLKRGAYKPSPVERTYIPKGDGRLRPIGKPTLEDKIVQRAYAEVVGAVYEAEFKGFSYGFRRGRSQHHALDAVTVAIERRKVNWVLDADIVGFFDAIDHEWLLKFLQHRIADRRMLRQVRKWLRAGVMEDGEWTEQQKGTPQGGSVSPVLANIYLHYVFDLWADRWRQQQAHGDVIIVRYADDFLVGFQYKSEAEQFLTELRERFAEFGLELHSDKTRLVEFGRYAIERRRERGVGKPETFDFLGLTHCCSSDRKGRFIVRRHTMRSRIGGKLKQIKVDLRRRLHDPVPEVGRWLGSILRGHYAYYGVPRNSRSMSSFRFQVSQLWYRSLRRRSQRNRITWDGKMKRLVERYLPRPQITHAYPNQRLRV
jgi:group II intron reverse transcriptase/maturase